MRGVGGQHLGPALAAVLVERAGEQHAGELALGPGARLKRDERQARYLAQGLLEAPHQLERALGVARVLERVQARVARQARDPLVQLGVVLHRARAERVEAGVEIEVPLGQAVVVADDLGLWDLRQARRLGAPLVRRQELVERALGHVDLGGDERAPARLGALEDRQRVVGLRDHAPAFTVCRLRRDRRPESVGQPVDVRAGPPLGDRDEQPVRVLLVVARERVAGVDALLAAARDHALDRRVELDRELAHHGPVVQLADAVDLPQALARVGGPLEHQLDQLDDPLPPEPAQVDHAGERVQRLRRADVRGRLLAADVLLAGLEGEHESALAVDVLGLARDPPGHAADQRLGGGEEPERRAAEVESVAERLALADGDVDAALAGRLEQRERQRVARADRERSGGVRGVRQGSRSSTAPRKFGCCTITALTSSPSSGRAVAPALSGASTTSISHAWASVRRHSRE